MFSIILIICSVSMSCLRSAEEHEETKEADDSEGIISRRRRSSLIGAVMRKRANHQLGHKR